MTSELERFIGLYDDIVRATDRWLAAMPLERLDWEPPGEMGGVGMSLRSSYVHLLVSEHDHIRDLCDCRDGEALGPLDKALTGRLMASRDLAGEAEAMHEANLARLHGLAPAELDKRVGRSGRDWTGMEFLWSLYAHRAFHLGNIDVVVRSAEVRPPAFYPSIARPG